MIHQTSRHRKNRHTAGEELSAILNSAVNWAIPVNKNTPLWRNVDCVRGGLSRPEYLSQGVIYMIDNNYVWGGGEEEEIY